MKKILVLVLLSFAVSQAQDLSTNEELLQRQINRLNLRKVNLRDSGSAYVSPSALEARISGIEVNGVTTDTTSLSNRINAKQNAGTYIVPSDTTLLSNRINGKQAAGTYATPATVAESIDVYTMTMSGWNIGTIPVRLNDSTIISLVIPSDSTQAASGGIWYNTADGIIRRKW